MATEKGGVLPTPIDNDLVESPRVGSLSSGKEVVGLKDTTDVEVGSSNDVERGADISDVDIKDDGMEGDYDADTSPFAAVRAVVPDTDDPDMPVNTLRAWLLGIVSGLLKQIHKTPDWMPTMESYMQPRLTDCCQIFVFVGSGVNQFFSLRYPGGEPCAKFCCVWQIGLMSP